MDIAADRHAELAESAVVMAVAHGADADRRVLDAEGRHGIVALDQRVARRLADRDDRGGGLQRQPVAASTQWMRTS